MLTLDCKERGRQRDGPLNHGTGKGWVKQVKGHYHDALYVKKSRVVVWLVETTAWTTRSTRTRPSMQCPMRCVYSISAIGVPIAASVLRLCSHSTHSSCHPARSLTGDRSVGPIDALQVRARSPATPARHHDTAGAGLA